MRQDVLEQLVDDYLQARGYFTRHNIRFRPRNTHRDYVQADDSVASDIDVIGVDPRRRGPAKVWAVSCKSWQSGFNVKSRLAELELNKRVGGRDAWKFFRELMVPKWSDAFRDAVKHQTGSRSFTYVTAVTRCTGDRRLWEQHPRFRKALRGNPIRLLSLTEMVLEILPHITKTPASSEMGRTLQLLRASGFLRQERAHGVA